MEDFKHVGAGSLDQAWFCRVSKHGKCSECKPVFAHESRPDPDATQQAAAGYAGLKHMDISVQDMD